MKAHLKNFNPKLNSVDAVMEDFYRVNPLISRTDDVVRVGNVTAASELHRGQQVPDNYNLQLEAPPERNVTGSDISNRLIKTQIANHPLYPNLVSAYIECQKVGAPPELASLLEEVGRENHLMINSRCEIGNDPELDGFMESYCEVLQRYKEELSRPFNEATLFLNKIESQLSNLCKGTLTKSSGYRSDEATGTSEEELSCGEVEVVEGHGSSVARPGDQDLKEMLHRKYSGYLSSLRKEFLKKRKKGKLPKDARMALLGWWNTHYRWPYPTEDEKLRLSEVTGLDQKQINNWFINQRKRHWKPSEDMQCSIIEGVSGGGIGGPMYFDSGGGPQRHDI